MVSGEKPNKKKSVAARANRGKPNKSSIATRLKTEQKPRENRTTLRQRLVRWGDEWKMALEGIGLACRRPKFVAIVAIVFLIFGTLMNLLTNGFSSFRLMAAVDFSGKMQIVGNAFLANFGVGRNFWDWAFVFVIALLQGILIGLVVLVWKKRPKAPQNKKHKRSQKVAKVSKNGNGSAATEAETAKKAASATTDNADNIQSAGIAAGLAVLSSGCPTCGTTLLAPVIGAISSTGGYALAGTITGVIFAAAIVVALWSVKKVGSEAYVIIISEDYNRRKHGK